MNIAVKGEQTVSKLCILCAYLAVRITKRSGRYEVHKLMDVTFEFSLTQKSFAGTRKKLKTVSG